MTTTDVRQLQDSSFVFHFGGRPNEIDAITFGNALVSLAEAVRAINARVNPGYSLEIAIEAVGPGSFRAKLKTAKKSLKNLFSASIIGDIAIGLLTTILWEKVISPDDPPTIIVQTDAVVIEYGADRIIVPKDVFEAKAKVERDPTVNKHIAKAMEVLDADPAVTSLGITTELRDPDLVAEFPKAVFPVIRQHALATPSDKSRFDDTNAVLSVHKAVFERSTRKWEFVWQGFRISAPILDDTFFDRLEAREISIRQGDAFEAKLRVHQAFDALSGTWLNDRYEVIAVGDIIHRRADQMVADL